MDNIRMMKTTVYQPNKLVNGKEYESLFNAKLTKELYHFYLLDILNKYISLQDSGDISIYESEDVEEGSERLAVVNMTTSNIIEGKISLFKNRIKSIGKRWSETGLLRWLAIAVRKLLPEYDWNTLWDNITGNPLPVEIKLSMITTKWGCH